jgi:N-acetylglucosamine-6-phosphate deacetylase
MVCAIVSKNRFTDVPTAMKILDPHLQDGVHDWRDGLRFYKEGDKLYLDGTTTLAGRFVYTTYLFCTLIAELQRGYPRQMRSELRALHGLLSRSSYQMCNLQSCEVNKKNRCNSHSLIHNLRCLNIENKKGTLRAGADADLAVLDHQGNVLSTWVMGKMVWARK